jgi:hypothetical protein
MHFMKNKNKNAKGRETQYWRAFHGSTHGTQAGKGFGEIG